MIKHILVLILIVFLFGECTAEDTDWDAVRAQYHTFEQIISTMSPDLDVYPIDDILCEDDIYTMTYGVNLSDKYEYYIVFEYITSKKQVVKIKFQNSDTVADAYSLRFFAELIDRFSETGKTLDEVEQACHDALTGKDIRFHKDAHLEIIHEMIPWLRYEGRLKSIT